MRRTAHVLALIASCTGCTGHQLALWVDWHADDPTAAIEYANRPEVQAELRADDGLRNRQGDGVWEYIAECESGGRWDYPPVTNSSGTYSGGLMIGHRWWPLLGGTDFAPEPWQATRAEQIHIAEKIVDEQGLDRGWMCWP